MRQLAKAFFDIAIWRRTPAHLPASLFLLALVSAAAALLDVAGALLLPGPNDKIVLQVALDPSQLRGLDVDGSRTGAGQFVDAYLEVAVGA